MPGRRSSPKRQHPGGVRRRRCAHLVEPFDLVVGEGQLRRAQIVHELVHPLGADDDAGDGLLRQQPGQRHLRHRRAVGLGNRPRDVEDVEGLFLVERREVERHPPSVGVAGALAGELTGEKAAGQRAPHQQAEALVADQRNRVALDVAAGQRVVGLRALEPLETAPLRHAERLHQLPRFEVRAADVAHLAGADQVGQGAQRLVDGRLGVGAVNLVEVDAVGAEPFQARLARVDDVQPGKADLVGAGPHAAAHLGRDHHVAAAAGQRAAEDLLRIAGGVDVGRVEEVDAGIEGPPHERVRLLLAQCADHLPLGAERHRTQAELRDVDSCRGQSPVLHPTILPGVGESFTRRPSSGHPVRGAAAAARPRFR